MGIMDWLFGGNKPENQRAVSDVQVLVLGDHGAGKRSIIHYYKDGCFVENSYGHTDKSVRCIKNSGNGETHVTFVFDESPDSVAPIFSHKKRDYAIILIVVDLSKDSFSDDVEKYKLYSAKHHSDASILTVGSKMDLLGDKSADIDRDVCLTSAKTGEGLDTFSELLDGVIAQSNERVQLRKT